MTAAQRVAARLHLEDARDSVTDARDGGPEGRDSGVILPGAPLYEVLSRVVRDLDRAIDELRHP